MQNISYLTSAYTAVWIGFFLYGLSIHRRLNQLKSEMRELKERLDK